MQKTHDIVQKLWNLCAVLRHGGVTYHQYVNELTYVLFLKMAEETGTESRIPEGCRWNRLRARAWYKGCQDGHFPKPVKFGLWTPRWGELRTSTP